MLKTFWGGPAGWRDRQLPDGTIEWCDPDGRTHLTTPGQPTAVPPTVRTHLPVIATGTPPAHTTGLTMPRRRTPRTADRARRINAERELNQSETPQPDCQQTDDTPDDATPPSDAPF